MKKSITITLIVLAVLILGAGIWYFFFHKGSTVTTLTNTNGSPFGTVPGNISSNGSSSGRAGSSATSTTMENGVIIVPRLFEISDAPVAGALAFINANGSTTIRYVDRATGHIYDVDPATLIKTEVSDNTLPKIYQAYFKSDGNEVVLRSLPNDGDAITNLSLALTPPVISNTEATSTATTTPLYAVSATMLQGDWGSIAVGPSGQLAYVESDTGDIAASNFDGSGETTLFSSPFKDWQISWADPSDVTLVTSASAGVDGFAYNLNVNSGHLSKLIGPANALTLTESPDGEHVAYSYDDNGQTQSAAENLSTGATTSILPATFPEKCVWSAEESGTIFCGAPTNGIGANEPDDWYQGATHFSDNLWKFDTNNGTAELLDEPAQTSGANLDVINPELSPNEDYLIFMNKTDLTLWGFKLQ